VLQPEQNTAARAEYRSPGGSFEPGFAKPFCKRRRTLEAINLTNDILPGGGTVDGLLLTKDLMFTSKVTGTAAAMGLRIQTIGSIEALASPTDSIRPRAVFVDLACAEFEPGTVIARLGPVPRPLVIAFGSHVDVERLELARAAGCDEVLPRSRFSSTLPELLRRVFGIN
jgi:hypothetical protein